MTQNTQSLYRYNNARKRIGTPCANGCGQVRTSQYHPYCDDCRRTKQREWARNKRAEKLKDAGT